MSIPQKSLSSLLFFCTKNFHNLSKFDKVLTKNKFAQFFLRHSVQRRCLIDWTVSSGCNHVIALILIHFTLSLYSFLLGAPVVLLYTYVAFMSTF